MKLLRHQHNKRPGQCSKAQSSARRIETYLPILNVISCVSGVQKPNHPPGGLKLNYAGDYTEHQKVQKPNHPPGGLKQPDATNQETQEPEVQKPNHPPGGLKQINPGNLMRVTSRSKAQSSARRIETFFRAGRDCHPLQFKSPIIRPAD